MKRKMMIMLVALFVGVASGFAQQVIYSNGKDTKDGWVTIYRVKAYITPSSSDMKSSYYEIEYQDLQYVKGLYNKDHYKKLPELGARVMSYILEKGITDGIYYKWEKCCYDYYYLDQYKDGNPTMYFLFHVVHSWDEYPDWIRVYLEIDKNTFKPTGKVSIDY